MSMLLLGLANGKMDWWVVSFSANEVDSEPGLGGAIVLGIKDAVIKRVSLLSELGCESVPKFAIVDNLGVSNILQDEVVGL